MDIILTTFNARYSHTSLALRCLRANLGALRESSTIVEFDIRISPHAAAEKLLAQNPKILLVSIYIWNATIAYETLLIIRKIRPDIKITIGGPEVGIDAGDSPLAQLADHLLCGEGEPYIENFCAALLAGETPEKIIRAAPADLNTVALPYDEYTDDDIAHRRVYVETSRGCPFKCEYCISSLENGVRFFPPEKISSAFEKLITRGARIFKFIDRSFNINTAHAAGVLQFFLDRRCDGMMLHLEWEPEILPPALEELLAAAPPRFFQIEAGVQTFNAAVAERIQRHLNPEKVEKHIRALAALPSVHLHADLIAGLPGETYESIAAGFDRLHACAPHEIQLGILKKLNGAPIARHDAEWEMIYNSAPPYDVLQTSTLSFADLQQIRRFARYWDITVNNGRFPNTAPLIWKNQKSVFAAFTEWSEWLYHETGTTAGITPPRLAECLNKFLSEHRNTGKTIIENSIQHDLNVVRAEQKGIERQTRK